MKFLVDMPLSDGLADWLTVQGYEAVHASRLGLFRAPDSEILAHARAEARIVVTADLDYPRLLALSGATSPAVILFRGGDWSNIGAIERLKVLLRTLQSHDIETSMTIIEKDRIRRRPLPLI